MFSRLNSKKGLNLILSTPEAEIRADFECRSGLNSIKTRETVPSVKYKSKRTATDQKPLFSGRKAANPIYSRMKQKSEDRNRLKNGQNS